MKLLTTRPLDYLDQNGHEFWKETAEFFKKNFENFELHYYIQEKADICIVNISASNGKPIYMDKVHTEERKKYF